MSSTVDWDAIERDYRLGKMTNTELAQSHGVGRGSLLRKAKREGWTRDLSAQVRTRTRAALMRPPAERVGDSQRDPEIDAAVQTSVAVIERHRRMLARGAEVAEKILAELDRATDDIEEIEDAIIAETAADKSTKRRAQMLKAVSAPSRAAAVNAIANTMRSVIAAERQAFNLNEPGEGDDLAGTKVVVVPAKDAEGSASVRRIEDDE